MKKYLLIFGISILILSALSGCIEQQTSGDIVSLSYVGGIYGSGSPNYLDGVQELKIHGDYLYVSTAMDYRVTILSVEDNKTNPVFVSSIPVGAVPRKLSISNDGNWIYLGTTIDTNKNYGSGNLTIINVTDKANPTIFSELVIDSDGGMVGCSYVDSKEICYLTSYWENMLYSVNVSDKSNPSIIANMSVGKQPHGVWANETIAFVLGHKDDIVYTFDVSNSSSLILLDSYQSSTLHRCSQVFAEYAPTIYVASLDSSIHIFDISNSSDIQRVSVIDNGMGTITCSVIPNAEQSVVFVTTAVDGGNYNGTISVYNIGDKQNPTLIDSVSNSEYVLIGHPASGALGVIDNYIYVGLWGDDGVSVFLMKSKLMGNYE